MRTHQCRIEGNDHVPRSAGYAPTYTSQNAIGLLGNKGTLPTHIQLSIEKVLEEATCSICLEYLTKPVTTDCGHNFCRDCIIQYSEHGELQSGMKIPCPQCRAPFQKLQPNRQLANIVKNIKLLGLKSGNVQKENLCERHEEKLLLFCEEDREAICVVCRQSQTHHTHAVISIQEAAQDYKVKLQEALGPLRLELEKALELTSEEEEKTTEWQWM
ncbi:unnamed protein product [Lepidochelys olivacea]